MKNRYDGDLQKNDFLLDKLTPSSTTSRYVAAFEIGQVAKPESVVLELGCGGGRSAKPILEITDVKMDLTDVSEDMIVEAKETLANYSDRVTFTCQDALEYLQACGKRYDLIYSAMTIHNFLWPDKHKVFQAIHDALADKGLFVMMDIVYPEDNRGEMHKKQIQRFRYLDPAVSEPMIAHVYQDYLPEYRMDEERTLDAIRQSGFSDVRIADRLERNIVLVANK